MSVLPSFKSAFSSLAEADTPAVRIADDSGIARSPPHRPWSPLHTSSSDRRITTTNTTPSARPTVPPLPLDNLVGEAPAFGFARSHKHSRPSVDPLPLELLGLAVDGLVYVHTESKRTSSPTVHAGAYKRPRTHSISAGGSYVKVSSQPSSEPLPSTHTPKLPDHSSPSHPRDPSTSNTLFPHPKPRDSLPHLSPSLSSSPHISPPSETRPTLPKTLPTPVVPPISSIPPIENLKTSNILSFAPPSITRSAASKPQLLSFPTQTPTAAPIIEDSTCQVPIDVLSSPIQRSLNSALTGRTAQLHRATRHTLALSRGPTASDLSHLLGPRTNINDDDVVDATDAVTRDSQRPVSQPPPLPTTQPLSHTERFQRERKVTEQDQPVVSKPQPINRQPNPLQSAQQSPQPPPQPPPSQQHPSRPHTNGSTSLSPRDLAFRRTSTQMQNGDKHRHVGYNSYSHHHSSTVPQSQGTDSRDEEQRQEPWRQQPRPQPINGIVHSQPGASASRDHTQDYMRHTSSSHPSAPYESRDARYTVSRAPTFGHTENVNLRQWNHSPRRNGVTELPNGTPVPSTHGRLMPNGSAQTIPQQDGVTGNVMNGHGGQLNDLLGNDTRDDAGSVQCPHCPRKLRNQVTLQNHIRVVHDHSGNFRCPQCGLTFMWRSTLGNHVRLVHEKQRPYACDQCAKAFRWKSHLREHTWVVHKGEKPFRCDTCGKTFGRKNNMQKHMRKHTEGAS